MGLTVQAFVAISGGEMNKSFCMFAAVAAVPMVQAAHVQELRAELQVGETQVLELKGNPTTGFLWALAEPLPADSPVQVTIEYEAAASPRGLVEVGRGGVFKVRYTGVAPGRAVVVLVYARPWEKDEAPHLKTILTVTVK